MEWQSDERTVRFDTTVLFSHGYDFFGLETFFSETVGLEANFIIWPDHSVSDTWNLYGGSQGWFQSGIGSRKEAIKEVERLAIMDNEIYY